MLNSGAGSGRPGPKELLPSPGRTPLPGHIVSTSGYWRMPEIGISGLPLDYPYSGTAAYVRHVVPLLPEVAPDLRFRLFVRWTDEFFPGVRRERIASPVAPLNRRRGAGAQLDKLLWEIGALPAAATMRWQTLLHSPTFAAPLVSPVPFIVTIHDLIPLIVP